LPAATVTCVERFAINARFLNELLVAIADRGRTLMKLDAGQRGTGRSTLALADALLSERGEASGVAIARALLSEFASLDGDEKSRLFRELIERFGADRERVERAIEAFRNAPGDRTVAELHDAAEPRRQELIRRLNLAPGGTAGLVAMRAEVLARLREEPSLAVLDHDFHHLLASWFNRGFLSMARIDWSTPAVILEKVIRYEAVHRIRDWDDLRSRIEPLDRRCYAFFHPALIDEPIIFVEVALTKEIPGAIAPVLATDREQVDPHDATTAVFYSISNCQKGLRGISFGNFLIKQVVEDLSRDLRDLSTFVTLSPVPGFRGWLDGALRDGSLDFIGDGARRKLAVLGEPGWQEDPRRSHVVSALLPSLAAHYLMRAKTGSGRPVDPVARFHLGNGARLERINWLADRSAHGVEQSAGIMVNYQYRLKDIERNHEAYANSGEVAASKAVTAMLNELPVAKAGN